MLFYKVTIEIKQEREDEWFKWMSIDHIPDVINTGLFLDFSFSKLIPNGSIPKQGYSKYEIRYVCRDQEDYDKYRNEFAAKLQQEHKLKFEGAFEASRETYEDKAREMQVKDTALA